MKNHPSWALIEAEVHYDDLTRTAYITKRPGEHEIALSQAISLKRIADALEQQNEIAKGITHTALWNGEPIE